MKLSQGLAAIVLGLSAVAAHAEEISSTVTVTSDYDFRGFTQTKRNPALQVSLDYSNDNGIYAGVWGSNVDFGDCCNENLEADIYAGWSGGETVAYDLGIVYYTYPRAQGIDYPEIYASATWKVLTGKFWYSWDFGNADMSAEYYQLDADIPLPANLTLGLHTGYSDGEYWGKDSYFDWSAGLSYSLGHFDLNLKWVDGSDYKPGDGTHNDVLSTEPRAIFTVSTTFPWKKEE